MCEALAAFGEGVQIEVPHLLEQDDHVAVRLCVSWAGASKGSAAMIGIYRFEGGRISEDWGVSTRAPWRR